MSDQQTPNPADENRESKVGNESTSSSAPAPAVPSPSAPPSPAPADKPSRRRPLPLFGYVRGLAASVFTLGNVLTVLAVLFAITFTAVLAASLELYAASHPAKSAYTTTPTALGLPYEDVSFSTIGGMQVSGWFVPAAVDSSAAILVLHGYGSNKEEMLPRVGFLSQYYNLLFVDFRYFGGGDGEFSTLGVREIEEASAAIKWLEARGFSRVGLYGFSMGGTVALRALAEEEATRCAVLESPYGDLRLIFHDAYRAFGPLQEEMTDLTVFVARLIGFDYREAVPPAVRSVRSPVLLFALRTDEVVPFAHAEAIVAALKDNRELEEAFFDGGKHCEIPPNFTEKTFSFFASCLGGDAL